MHFIDIISKIQKNYMVMIGFNSCGIVLGLGSIGLRALRKEDIEIVSEKKNTAVQIKF
jgi:hypothetical protein